MIPAFVLPEHVSLPSPGSGTFWDFPGGSSHLDPDLVASPAVYPPQSIPWVINAQDLAAVGPYDVVTLDASGFDPTTQIGWQPMLRPGAGVFVSSWGRAASGVALAKLAASRHLDSGGVFDGSTPSSFYVKRVGGTSSTPLALVFETWWQHGIIKLAKLLAEQVIIPGISAPELSNWVPAKFDANPNNAMAHNIVPWLQGDELPTTGVDTRYVLTYAQQNRRAWAYCLLMAEALLKRGATEMVGEYAVVDIADAFGLVGPTMAIGRAKLDLLRSDPSLPLGQLPRDFVNACPALPTVFDTVVSQASGQTFPARGPDAHPVLSFWHPDKAATSPLGGLFVQYVNPVIEAIAQPEAVAARETRPGGLLVQRGSGLRKPAQGGPKPARRAQAPAAECKPLGEPLIGYFLNPQVRGMAELIELYLANRESVLTLYAAHPEVTPPNP